MEYNRSILEKIRKGIIGTLSGNEFEIGEDYRLSSVDINKTSFILSTGRKTHGNISAVSRKFLENTNEPSIKASAINANETILDVSEVYRIKETEMNGRDEKVEIQPTDKNVAEKSTKIIAKTVTATDKVGQPTVQEETVAEIVPAIEPTNVIVSETEASVLEFLNGRTQKEAGINLQPVKPGETVVRIHCNTNGIRQELLLCLERNNEILRRIGVTFGTTMILIFFSERDGKYIEDVEILQNFIKRLQAQMDKQGIAIVVKTPLSLAVSGNPIQLVIQLIDPRNLLRLADELKFLTPVINEEKEIILKMSLAEVNTTFVPETKPVKKPIRAHGIKNQTKSEKFTDQKERIIDCLCRGEPSKDIADEIGVSYATFLTLRKKIFKELGLKSIVGIILYGLKKGLCTTDHVSNKSLNLSQKKKEIMKGICMEKSEAEIGIDTGLNPSTIPVYRSEILEEIGGTSVADIVLYAVKHGLYSLEESTGSLPETNGKIVEEAITDNFPDGLVLKEIEMIKHLCDDKTLEEIQELLTVNSNELKAIVRKIFRTTKTKGIAGIVVYAIKNGLFVID